MITVNCQKDMEWIEEEHEEIITAPSAVTIQRGVAYVIEDPTFDEFPVYESANAWWIKSRRKVEMLIEAFKQGHTVETACFYAGISKGKWQYFNEVHPEFSALVQTIKRQPMYLKAMNSVAGGLDSDPKLALAFLRSTHPDFKRQEKVEPPAQVVQQSVQVAVSQNVDTTKIEEILKIEAQHFFVDGGTEGVADEDD